MASNKNQHFVPRAYLKAFTLDGDGAAINLLNLDRLKAVRGAPAKNQCSRDYFYGKDLVIERALQQVEGAYATVLKDIGADDFQLTDLYRDFLLDFFLLQHLRTEAASRRAVEMSSAMGAVVGDAGEIGVNFRMEVGEAVQVALSAFVTARNLISDLRTCLVRNQTNRDFITSDDPAVMTNRWHLTDRRAQGISPGLPNSGAVLLLPLTPKLLFVAYDGGVHTIPHRNHWVNITRREDVDAVNELQVLHSVSNLYFENWTTRDSLIDGARRVIGRRVYPRHRVNRLVFDREEDGARVFRPAIGDEVSENEIIHVEALLPTPERWPRFLGWRADGAIYDSHTALGFLRAGTRNEVDGPTDRLRSRR